MVRRINAQSERSKMNIDKFLEVRTKLLEESLALTLKKGKDYTKGSEDVLRNFKETGADLGLSPEQVWGIFAKKHFDAIMSYIKHGGKHESEPIAERIKDLLNYLVLLYAILNEQPKGKTLVDILGDDADKVDKSKHHNLFDEDKERIQILEDLRELFSTTTFTIE